jgi:hypothetical protein
MYAVIRRYTYSGQGMAELINEKGDDLRRTMAMTPGFKSYSMILSERTSTLATVTVCDDAAGTSASNPIAAAWVKANVPTSITLGPPETLEGEVALST